MPPSFYKEKGLRINADPFLAGLDGVEPSRRESKSRVLPLDYSPIFSRACGILPYFRINVKRNRWKTQRKTQNYRIRALLRV